MKRLIDGAALIGKLRTRKVMSINPTAQDAFETAMWDAMQADEVTLNTLRDAIYEDAVAHGLWLKYDIIVKGCAKDFELEGNPVDEEALNRAWTMEAIRQEVDELEASSKSPEEYAEELADVIISSLSVAGRLGIDIDAAVRRKMEINKGRAWKHGKE